MRKPVKSVIWACAITLVVDLAITEAWMDIRPHIADYAYADEYRPSPFFLPRCDMEDGRDIDFAVLWTDKPKCVDVAKDEMQL